MAVRLGDVLWWLGLLLGGGVWVALLALAHSAGPIDEAVFWASLIAALPIGFGYLCRYILSGKVVTQPILSSIRQHYRRFKMHPLKAGHGLE